MNSVLNWREVHWRVERTSRTILCCAALAAVWCSGCGSNVQPNVNERTLVLRHVTVIDGTGAPAREEQTVIVAGDRIAAVGQADQIEVPDGAEAIDASGLYVIPGLWDMHVHTRYQGIDFLNLFLAHGITGIRDMAGPWDHFKKIQQWQTEFDAGARVGPRIVSAGPLLDGAGSPWSHAAIVENPEGGREVVKRLKTQGADFVKVYNLLSRETFFAISEEAREQRLSFAGHVPLSVSAGEASDAGQKTIEHLTGVLLACSNEEERLRTQWAEQGPPYEELLRTFNDEKAGALFETFARNQTWHVPTLVNSATRLHAREGDLEVLESDALKYLPGAYREQFLGPRRFSGSLQTGRAVYEKTVQLVGLMHKAGVRILAGTDTLKPFLIPGASLHGELELLVEAGLTPMEALQTATRNPAILLGIDELGTVEDGKIADLVLLDANPLDDIRNTRRVVGVIVRGQFLDKAELMALLESVEETAFNYSGEPTGR